MNRTSKLMAAVTASLLLSGPLPGAALPAGQAGHAEPQPDESWKTDPQVTQAADSISGWLAGTPCQYNGSEIDKSKSKTQSEIAAQFPQFPPKLLQNALQQLLYRNSARRIGDGSEGNPFRYCEVVSGGHG